jgi:hypothetical protein
MLAFVSDRWMQRKAILYICAGLRCLWDLLYDDSSRDAVDVAERHADGAASTNEVERASYYAEAPTFGFDFDAGYILQRRAEGSGFEPSVRKLMKMGVYTEADLQPGARLGDPPIRSRLENAAHIAYHVVTTGYIQRGVLDEHLIQHLSALDQWPGDWLIRDIVGNPFRLVTAARAWLSWNEATIPKMAQGIYDERAVDRLPILADALEDAGCDNADILAHCRAPGPHVRGCWVVDLILGKE